MFVDFDPFVLLFWIFLSSLIPGAMLSFSAFRKSEFGRIEKVLAGFGIGLILLPMIPFLAYFLLGIQFSSTLVMASVAMLYIASIAVFVKTKAYEDVPFDFSAIKPDRKLLGSIGILLIVLIAFWLRMSSYSPVFQELDPYYYTFAPYQLLEFGENPFDDQTAWYPMEVNHRIVPALSYLEASWYSLYTGGTEPDNMMLAVISSIYPPIMAALAFFFLYLFISASFRREWALLGAGMASFVPIIIIKTMAGEQEVQPYAFFALAFFMAMYAFMAKTRETRYALLAGLAFMAVSLGSSSQLLALSMFMLFVLFQSLAIFIRDDDNSELGHFLKNNAIVFILGPVLGSFLKSSFSGNFYLGIADKAIIPLAVGAVLFAIPILLKKYKPSLEYNMNNRLMMLGVFFVIGLLLFAMTPLGDLFRSVGVSGFGIASFTSALHRTIAEQGVTGGMLSQSMGFVASGYPDAIGWLMAIPSAISNALMAIIVGSLNLMLGTDVEYSEKSSSLLLLFVLLFFLSMVYAFYKLITGKEKASLIILFAVIVIPSLLVGIIKAKYTIYAAFMLAAAIAFIFGEASDLISRYLKSAYSEEKAAELSSQVHYVLLVIAGLILLFQFLHNAYAPTILESSFMTRFQDDPMALQGKFSQICDETNDPDVCAAAADPIGYASQGTNYQYNAKLCYLSLVDDVSNLESTDYIILQSRCHRISDYWIESMEWLRYNTVDSRTTSWWDYGHWINYFGLQDTVLRNEHASHDMIKEVAHAYIMGTPEELESFMRNHDSDYALFDTELVSSGSQLGGKYGALNYLACSRNNLTDVGKVPGQSECESNNLWEVIVVPSNAQNHMCTISEHGNRAGVTAYRIVAVQQNGDSVYLQNYPSYCRQPIANQNTEYVCRNYIKLEPAYCVGNVVMADGSNRTGTYYIDKEYPNGDLMLNKGLMVFPTNAKSTYHLGDATALTMLYTNDMIWTENGQVKSGYEDRKGGFYDSNLYRALFLEEVPGFEHAFTSSGGQVKIFRYLGQGNPMAKAIG